MRLIDADELKSKKEYSKERHEWVVPVAAIDWMNIIEAAPVVHGKIIKTIENGKYKRVFSCCGEDFTKMTMWYTPCFCPNCGAKMDKK